MKTVWTCSVLAYRSHCNVFLFGIIWKQFIRKPYTLYTILLYTQMFPFRFPMKTVKCKLGIRLEISFEFCLSLLAFHSFMWCYQLAAGQQSVRSCASLTHSAYDLWLVHPLISSIHILLGLPRCLLPSTFPAQFQMSSLHEKLTFQWIW